MPCKLPSYNRYNLHCVHMLWGQSHSHLTSQCAHVNANAGTVDADVQRVLIMHSCCDAGDAGISPHHTPIKPATRVICWRPKSSCTHVIILYLSASFFFHTQLGLTPQNLGLMMSWHKSTLSIPPVNSLIKQAVKICTSQVNRAWVRAFVSDETGWQKVARVYRLS